MPKPLSSVKLKEFLITILVAFPISGNLSIVDSSYVTMTGTMSTYLKDMMSVV